MTNYTANEVWASTRMKQKRFTPKNDQYWISPAASPVNITSHSMENLAFHSLVRWRWLECTNSLYLTYTLLFTILNLGVKGLKSDEPQREVRSIEHGISLCPNVCACKGPAWKDNKNNKK